MLKNHQFTRAFILLPLALFICLFSCRRDPETVIVKKLALAQSSNGFSTTPYSIKVPRLFPQPYIPADNPMTVEGVTLGRYLFYDSILSGNYKQSCSSCHHQQFAFSNGNVRFSTGSDGITLGTRNAPALFNKAWDLEGMPPYGGFFWDGRAKSLEDQALMPLLNPIEMNIGDINIAVQRLQSSPMYPAMFQKAFGSSVVVKENIAKAIAQFVRSIVSGNSLYDSMKSYGLGVFNTDQQKGLILVDGGTDPTFFKNTIDRDPGTGLDCFHCHAAPLFTPDPTLHPFLNNGLTGTDGNGNLITLFKVPSLRNIMLTMPYMHDGQLANIDSVIAHYDHGNSAINSPYLSDFMFYKRFGRDKKMNLSTGEISQIKEFLSTLTDNTLMTNPAYKNPFL